ncbi:MAG: hydrolase [Chloroflexi bacterium]|nr:hydrolase [Chloroflexota bacterium]
MNKPARDPALRHDPAIADSADQLRQALAHVRALVIDIDGVLVLAGQAIPGAVDGLAELDRRGIPWRILTNTSTATRPVLSERMAGYGLAIPPERITTSLSAAAAYTAAHHPGEPLFVIAAPAALPEFEGQRLMAAKEADQPGARAGAVVIGDGGDDLSYRNLNRAFRLVRRGAALLAMHRNAWWLTEQGETFDIGGYVVGLEFATGVRAIVTGKPSPLVFRQAAADLVAELERATPGRAAHRTEVAMVGDDVQKDILASRRAGLRSILVLSGNDGAAELRAASRGRERVASAVATSFAAAVAALS